MIDYNPMSLEGKTFLVTGAASGIGAEVAKLISLLGGNLLLWDKNIARLEDVRNDVLQINKVNVHINEVDLCNVNEIQNLMLEETKKNKKLNGLVHCAGIPSIVPLRMLKKEEIERVMQVNTFAAIELIKVFQKKTVSDSSKMSSIVLISSVYGGTDKGSACNLAYAASKAAIVGITKSLAVELAPKNIRVNCIVPGFINTAMGEAISDKFAGDHDETVAGLHLLGMGTPWDIANGIAFLLSDASKWMTGSIVNIDGGFSCK